MPKVQRRSYSCKRNGFVIRGMEYKAEKNTGIPVIMSHAFLMNQKVMKKYAVELARQGYVVFTYDFCGGAIFSKSDGDFSDMTIDTEKEDLICVINYVKTLNDIDIRRLILFGASQGGFVSCLVAAELKEKIDKLVLIYPAFCIPDDAKKGKMMTIEFDPENIEQTFKRKMFKLSPEYPKSAIRIDIYEEIKKISCPMLIIHGDQDKIVDLGYAQKALETSKNERSDLKIIEGAGHGFNRKQFKTAMKYVFDYFI
ncbi:MAG: alpha/beta fold hydrolase [Lachnospiraceae bacterium]|nr:alpha/beta fold hydrolase [Lachnospiraceae bacterium]